MIVGTYTGTLTRTAFSNESGCDDDESVSWNIRIRKGEEGIIFLGGFPFFGNYSGSATATGFLYISDPSDTPTKRKNTVTATNLTETAAYITLTQEVEKLGKVTCQVSYAGDFQRDPTPPEE